MAKGGKIVRVNAKAKVMAKRMTKHIGTAKGCAPTRHVVTKVVLVKPEAAKEMDILKKHAVRLKKEAPSDWPEGAVPNVRCSTPLPDGWQHAMKVTAKSGRGGGGILRRCYIGPGGLVKWHKSDLEKHLGVKIETDHEHGNRFISPLVFDEFPEEATIRRTDSKVGSEYMVKRCDGLDGKTVSDSLYNYKYKSGSSGESVQYTVSDLRYDIKGGRIILETAGVASQLVKKEQGKKTHASARLTRQDVPSSSSRSSPSSSSRSSPIAAPSLQTSKPSKLALKHIKQSVFKPLLSRAAKGGSGESDIYTMLGVGHQLKMDQLMLNVLPDVLRKSPAERGSFGEGVLKQFEAELNKCL